MTDWTHMSAVNAPRNPEEFVTVMLRDGSVYAGKVKIFNWYDETKPTLVAKYMRADSPAIPGALGDSREALAPTEEAGGTKHDQAKPRMELLDPYAIEQLAEVLTFGAKKYAPHNWRKGITKGRLLAAALRHLFAYLGGQDKDPETGLSHVAHAMCCCMFLLGLEGRPELDDRWKK